MACLLAMPAPHEFTAQCCACQKSSTMECNRSRWPATQGEWARAGRKYGGRTTRFGINAWASRRFVMNDSRPSGGKGCARTPPAVSTCVLEWGAAQPRDETHSVRCINVREQTLARRRRRPRPYWRCLAPPPEVDRASKDRKGEGLRVGVHTRMR